MDACPGRARLTLVSLALLVAFGDQPTGLAPVAVVTVAPAKVEIVVGAALHVVATTRR